MTFHKTLTFLRLTDSTGALSLTNIALIVVIVKVAISAFDYVGAATLIPVFAAYAHKRYSTSKQDSKTFSKLQEQLSSVQEQVSTFTSSNEEAVKALTEAKKIISSSNLAQGFTPRGR